MRKWAGEGPLSPPARNPNRLGVKAEQEHEQEERLSEADGLSLSHRLPCPRSQSETGAPRIYFFSRKGFAEGGTGSFGAGLR